MLALLSTAGSYPYMTGPLTLFFSTHIHSHECHFYTFPLYTKLKPIPKSRILITSTIPDRSPVHTPHISRALHRYVIFKIGLV